MDDLWHGVYVLAWKVPDGFVQTSEAKKPSSYLQGITATETPTQLSS
jgi:hypothetical protein